VVFDKVLFWGKSKFMKYRPLLLSTVLVFGVFTGPVSAAVRPKEVAVEALPGVWAQVPVQERLKALRAAEVDGTRLLLERIMGLHVGSETTVRDLVLANDSVRGQLEASIKGVTSSEAPTYLPDGRLEVVRAVKVRQLIEVVSKVSTQQLGAKGVVSSLTTASNKTVDARTETFDVVGSSAVAGSEGHRKILAKRAAEMDAYRKLGERLLGVKVSSNTTVKDLAIKSDEVVKTMAGLVKGAEATDIQFGHDGGCSVTMQVNLGDVLRTVTRTANGKSSIEDSIRQEIISETGNGAPPEQSSVAQREPSVQVSQSSTVPVPSSPLDDDESILQQLLAGGDGVQRPQYENGRLVKVFIVSYVPLDAGTAPQFAKSAARQVASARAQASFVKFLKSNVSVVERGEQSYLVEARGEGGGAGNIGSEKSRFSSSGSSLTHVQAEGFARGIVAKKEIIQDSTLIAIHGWSQNSAMGARVAESQVTPVQMTLEESFRRMLNSDAGKK
jgi:hypothetical protein